MNLRALSLTLLLLAASPLAFGQQDTVRFDRSVVTKEGQTSIQVRLNGGGFRVTWGGASQWYGQFEPQELAQVRELLRRCKFPQLPPTIHVPQPDASARVTYKMFVGQFGASTKTRPGGKPFNPVFIKLDEILDQAVARTQMLAQPHEGDFELRKLTGTYEVKGRDKSALVIDGRRYPLEIASAKTFTHMLSLRDREVQVVGRRKLGHDDFELVELLSPTFREGVPVVVTAMGEVTYVQVDGQERELEGPAAKILRRLAERDGVKEATVDGFASKTTSGRPSFVAAALRATKDGQPVLIVGTHKGNPVILAPGAERPVGTRITDVQLDASKGLIGAMTRIGGGAQ